MTTETGSQDMSEILLLEVRSAQKHHIVYLYQENSGDKEQTPPIGTRKSRLRVIQDDDDTNDTDQVSELARTRNCPAEVEYYQSGPTQITQIHVQEGEPNQVSSP